MSEVSSRELVTAPSVSESLLLNQALSQEPLPVEPVSLSQEAPKVLGSSALFGAAAREAQFANLTANVSRRPKGIYFAN